MPKSPAKKETEKEFKARISELIAIGHLAEAAQAMAEKAEREAKKKK